MVPVREGPDHEPSQSRGNRAAYDDFLVWLDKSMREALKTTAVPSKVDKLQGARADVKPRA
jgi:hypothetical protein